MSDISKNDKYAVPETSAGDAVHQVLRAAVSVIPVLGGPAAELVNSLLSPVLDRRRKAWMEDIAEGLRQLEGERNISIEDLARNDTFVDTVLEASQAAMRTSQEDKLDALRNAVLNAALAEAPDASYQQMYLRFVEEFNEWHIRILALFDDPVGVSKTLGRPVRQMPAGSLGQILTNAYPDLANHKNLYKQVWRDLYSRGLVTTQDLHVTMTGQGLTANRTSSFGKAFLRFISAPA